MNKKIIKGTAMILTVLILSIISAAAVSAIGVAPARKVIDFQPGKTTLELLLINNEHKDFKALIFAKGELQQYIKFKKNSVKISAAEDYQRISYEIDLPEDMKDASGLHTAEIVIMEVSKESSADSQTAVSAVGAVELQLQVKVPYPGKYAEARMYVSDADVNKPAVFTIQMFNFGQERIEKAKAKISIFKSAYLGNSYERVATIETDSISIEPNQEGKLAVQWLATVSPGVYQAIATIEYDGEIISIGKSFNVGELLVEINKIEVKDFVLGSIAQFDIYLENKWSEIVPNVYCDLSITDKQGSILTKFRTESIDLPPLSQAEVKGYWDTQGVDVGRYDAKLTLNYAGKSSEKLFEIDVNLDSIRTIMPVAKVVQTGKETGKDSVLVMLVIILIIINVTWFIYWKKRKK